MPGRQPAQTHRRKPAIGPSGPRPGKANQPESYFGVGAREGLVGPLRTACTPGARRQRDRRGRGCTPRNLCARIAYNCAWHLRCQRHDEIHPERSRLPAFPRCFACRRQGRAREARTRSVAPAALRSGADSDARCRRVHLPDGTTTRCHRPRRACCGNRCPADHPVVVRGRIAITEPTGSGYRIIWNEAQLKTLPPEMHDSSSFTSARMPSCRRPTSSLQTASGSRSCVRQQGRLRRGRRSSAPSPNRKRILAQDRGVRQRAKEPVKPPG